MTIYMSIGMSIGMSAGLVFGMIFNSNNMVLGLSVGLPIGMCMGMAIGAAKDKRLSEKMMVISKIEVIDNLSNVMIYSVDKNGTVKAFRVTQKIMKGEKFAVGDRVAEETDGSLISLESR